MINENPVLPPELAELALEVHNWRPPAGYVVAQLRPQQSPDGAPSLLLVICVADCGCLAATMDLMGGCDRHEAREAMQMFAIDLYRNVVFDPGGHVFHEAFHRAITSAAHTFEAGATAYDCQRKAKVSR